jgi:hypothetical protein
MHGDQVRVSSMKGQDKDRGSGRFGRCLMCDEAATLLLRGFQGHGLYARFIQALPPILSVLYSVLGHGSELGGSVLGRRQQLLAQVRDD